jgi:hypothetical protein
MTLIVKTGFNGMTDADAIAYVNAVEAADGQLLEFGVGKAINDFVVGCKLDNTWNAIKASCILAGARTRLGALTPLVGTAPTSFNFVDGDYNRKTGLVGDGSTKYLDANRNNNVDPQNSKHFATYGSGFTASQIIAGNIALGTGRLQLSRASSGNTFEVSVNNADAPFTFSQIVTGFLGVVRTSNTVFSARHNSQTITNSSGGGFTSATPVNSATGIFRFGNSYGTPRLAFYSIGESLDLALLDARVTDLINAFAAAIP